MPLALAVLTWQLGVAERHDTAASKWMPGTSPSMTTQ